MVSTSLLTVFSAGFNPWRFQFPYTLLDSSLKIKKIEIVKICYENILSTSKRKPNLIESDDGKVFMSKNFANLLNKNDNKGLSHNRSL